MMAAKQPGRRAPRTAPGRRRWLTWLPWVLGLLIGLGAGAGMILIYPPPSTDMIKVQAVNWYASMRNLVAPSSSGASAQSWVTDAHILADAPIALPPEAEQDDELLTDDVADLLNVNAPIPDPEQLAAALDDATAELGLHHRMMVADAATGQTLYESGGADAIVPASTLKLFTAVSVLEHLDTTHRFTTSATYAPGDGVTLVGGGDGLLSTGEGTGTTVGYAGLADLAQETWDAIADDIPADASAVNVWADVSRYAGPWVHPQWTDGLMESGWVSPIYPLNTWGGLVADPQYDNTAVEDGAAYATDVLARHLTDLAAADNRNIEFSYVGYKAAAPDTESVAQVRSATLGAQLEFAMKQSNNMLFEMFGREAALAAGAPADFTGSTQTTMSVVDDLGLDTQHLDFVDNSGLSPSNRATLQATVQLFETILTEEHYRPLLDTLTIAGYDGTMRHRMDQAPYAGIVRSKTGTLEAASSNAGLTITADGRALWFVINTSGADGDYEAAREEQDHLAEVVTDCGCNAQ